MLHRIIAKCSFMPCVGCPITLKLKMYSREEVREKAGKAVRDRVGKEGGAGGCGRPPRSTQLRPRKCKCPLASTQDASFSPEGIYFPSPMCP